MSLNLSERQVDNLNKGITRIKLIVALKAALLKIIDDHQGQLYINIDELKVCWVTNDLDDGNNVVSKLKGIDKLKVELSLTPPSDDKSSNEWYLIKRPSQEMV